MIVGILYLLLTNFIYNILIYYYNIVYIVEV